MPIFSRLFGGRKAEVKKTETLKETYIDLTKSLEDKTVEEKVKERVGKAIPEGYDVRIQSNFLPDIFRSVDTLKKLKINPEDVGDKLYELIPENKRESVKEIFDNLYTRDIVHYPLEDLQPNLEYVVNYPSEGGYKKESLFYVGKADNENIFYNDKNQKIITLTDDILRNDDVSQRAFILGNTDRKVDVDNYKITNSNEYIEYLANKRAKEPTDVDVSLSYDKLSSLIKNEYSNALLYSTFTPKTYSQRILENDEGGKSIILFTTKILKEGKEGYEIVNRDSVVIPRRDADKIVRNDFTVRNNKVVSYNEEISKYYYPGEDPDTVRLREDYGIPEDNTTYYSLGNLGKVRDYYFEDKQRKLKLVNLKVLYDPLSKSIHFGTSSGELVKIPEDIYNKLKPKIDEIIKKSRFKDKISYFDIFNNYKFDKLINTSNPIETVKKYKNSVYIGMSVKENNYGNIASHKISKDKTSRRLIKADDEYDAQRIYEKWLLGEDYKNIDQERRKWILEQIVKGELDNKFLVTFYGERHGEVLLKLINNKELAKKALQNKQVKKFAIDTIEDVHEIAKNIDNSVSSLSPEITKLLKVLVDNKIYNVQQLDKNTKDIAKAILYMHKKEYENKYFNQEKDIDVLSNVIVEKIDNYLKERKKLASGIIEIKDVEKDIKKLKKQSKELEKVTEKFQEELYDLKTVYISELYKLNYVYPSFRDDIFIFKVLPSGKRYLDTISKVFKVSNNEVILTPKERVSVERYLDTNFDRLYENNNIFEQYINTVNRYNKGEEVLANVERLEDILIDKGVDKKVLIHARLLINNQLYKMPLRTLFEDFDISMRTFEERTTTTYMSGEEYPSRIRHMKGISEGTNVPWYAVEKIVGLKGKELITEQEYKVLTETTSYEKKMIRSGFPEKTDIYSIFDTIIEDPYGVKDILYKIHRESCKKAIEDGIFKTENEEIRQRYSEILNEHPELFIKSDNAIKAELLRDKIDEVSKVDEDVYKDEVVEALNTKIKEEEIESKLTTEYKTLDITEASVITEPKALSIDPTQSFTEFLKKYEGSENEVVVGLKKILDDQMASLDTVHVYLSFLDNYLRVKNRMYAFPFTDLILSIIDGLREHKKLKKFLSDVYTITKATYSIGYNNIFKIVSKYIDDNDSRHLISSVLTNAQSSILGNTMIIDHIKSLNEYQKPVQEMEIKTPLKEKVRFVTSELLTKTINEIKEHFNTFYNFIQSLRYYPHLDRNSAMILDSLYAQAPNEIARLSELYYNAFTRHLGNDKVKHQLFVDLIQLYDLQRSANFGTGAIGAKGEDYISKIKELSRKAHEYTVIKEDGQYNPIFSAIKDYKKIVSDIGNILVAENKLDASAVSGIYTPVRLTIYSDTLFSPAFGLPKSLREQFEQEILKRHGHLANTEHRLNVEYLSTYFARIMWNIKFEKTVKTYLDNIDFAKTLTETQLKYVYGTEPKYYEDIKTNKIIRVDIIRQAKHGEKKYFDDNGNPIFTRVNDKTLYAIDKEGNIIRAIINNKLDETDIKKAREFIVFTYEKSPSYEYDVKTGKYYLSEIPKSYLITDKQFKTFNDLKMSNDFYHIESAMRVLKTMMIYSHYVPYNVTNALGDIYIAMMQHPNKVSFINSIYDSIALSTKLAYNNAVAYLNKKGINVKPKEYTDFESKLKSELVEYGVLSSGLVSELSNFKDTKNILTHVLKVIRDSQEFRENILRIACYIDGKKALNKSEADALSWIDKWKWYKDDVQSIINFGDYQKAIAKISSDYLINYQTTSKMYNLIFRSLIFPFGHFYLQINKIIGKMLLTKPLKTLGWLSFIPTFCAVWNNYMGNYFYPDNKITEAYNELPDEIRHQPVIVLGYDKYGFIKAINFGFFPPDILVGGSIINQLISRTINIAFHPENSTTYLKFLHNLFDGTLDRETKKIKLLLNPIFRFVYGGMTGVDYVDGRYIFDVHPEQRHYLSMNQKFTKLLQYFSSVMIPIAGTYIAQTTKKIPVEEKEAFYEIFRNIFGYDEVNGFNYLIGMRRYDPYIYSNEKIKEYQELSTRMLQFIVDMKKEYYKSDLPVEDFIRTPEVISKVSTFIRDNNFKTKEGIKEISERIIESLNDEYTFYLKILSMRNRAVNNGDFKKAKVLNEALSKTDIKVKQSIKTIYKAIKIEEANKGEK